MSLNPTLAVVSGTHFGEPPGAGPGAPPSAKPAIYTITMGASDTYVTGGFSLYAANTLGNTPQIPYFDLGILFGCAFTQTPQTWVPQITCSNGVATVKFVQGGYDQYSTSTTILATGTGTVAANTNLTTVSTGVQNLSCTTPINISLTNTLNLGTWGTTAGVGPIYWISPTEFTFYTNVVAPSGGGGYYYDIPSTGQASAAEIPAGTSVASVVLAAVLFGY